MEHPRLDGWILRDRSPRSRIALDLEDREGKPFAVVAHEIRYSEAHDWRRRRAVALSAAELETLHELIGDLLCSGRLR